jgi:tetratricopeptide (TPR) repeat protein
MQRFSAGPRLLLTVCALTAASMLIAEDDESLTARYFDQMRQRGLFSLAESHAESRLTDPLLSPARRMELVIELSRTLVAHAVAAGDDQQAELWEKAAAVLAEELAATGESPRRIVLEVYAGLVPAARAEQLAWDVEASPFEEPYREALDRVCADALRKLARVEESLAGRIRSLEGRKKSSAEISVHELRQLLSLTRWKEGTTLLAKARLSPPGSQERHSDVLDADERFRKVLGSGSERWHAAARLGLATGNRLRDEFGRALEMLDQLERDQKMKEAGLADALRLERVRILLQTQQPAAAADELLQMRTGRDRLPGEFWLAQFQALSALRRAASQRSASALVAQLDEQAQKDLKFVDAQAGGVWSRRCRAIWSGTQSVERYGQRLAAQLAKAQAEYLAGRIDSAMTAYAAAVEWAHEDGKSDVEMDVGYTLAAVLAKGGRWEEAARRCRQLVAAHPDHPQAAEIDMFGLHAAGRSLDEQPSDERRTAYAEALAEHLRRFPGSSTVSEAEYLRGRLLEAGGHPAEAMAAYLRVKPDHVRSAAASAAVGRCLVAQLLLTRESGKTDLDLERQSLELVAQRLRGLPEQPPSWNDEQAELAYQAVKLYLLLAPPRFNDAERWLDRLDQATSTSDETAEPDGVRAELRRRSGPLRLVALAGLGR